MRSFVHDDGRGARLGADDKAAIRVLYGTGGGGGGGSKPAAPTGLQSSGVTTSQVTLTWVDHATTETSYRVERKTTGSFSEILILNANVTSTVVSGLSHATTYYFRVRARNNSGPSGYSNTVAVATPSALPAAPTALAATPLSSTQIQLTWQDKSNNETGFGIEASSPASNGFTAIGAVAAADSGIFTVNNLQPGTPYTFRVRALGAAGNSGYTNDASASTPGAGGPCSAAADTLCLTGGRFRVKAQWRRPDGSHGIGTAVPYANGDQTGLFWFFDAANIELLVKVLDGTSINQHFWVFYGALSNVQYWITVEDTQLGHSVTYHNIQDSICGKADIGSLSATAGALGRFVELPADPGGSWSSQSQSTIVPACVPDATTLCLLGGRFRATVNFTVPTSSGAGHAVPLAADTSGIFWFFDSSNAELVVKALDATALNGKYWLFYGALTDVQYDLTVTDTVTLAQRVYHNTQGNLCGKGDTNAFTP